MRPLLLSLLMVSGSLAACSTSAQQSTTSPPASSPTPQNLPKPYDPAQDKALNPPQAPQKKQPVVKPTANDAPVMVLRKTRCYGTCPAYTATVYADGRVAYEGLDFVQLKGRHELRLPVAVIDEVVQRANALDFSQLPRQYLAGATDLPSTYLTLALADGTQKTVQVESSRTVPVALQSLLTYLTGQVEKVTGGAAQR